MIPRLFEKNATTFTNYGICPLADAIMCKVTEERNNQFVLEMDYPRDGLFVDEIVIDRIILADPADNASAQPFRITEIEYDMNGDIHIEAEQIGYQLNNIIIGANDNSPGTTDPSVFWSTEVSHMLSTSCPFTFTTDITASSAKPFGCSEATPLRKLLGGMEGSMLDLFGGEFKWDKFEVSLLSARGADNGVKIAYTKNLTGLEYSIDMSDVYTGVVAFYSGQDGYEESDVQEATHSYGYNRDIVIDATDQFETLPTKADLNTYASSYLASHTSTPSVSVEAEFIPLWQTEEYKDFYGLEHVSLCDTVEVLYPPLGLDLKAKVVKTVYDVLADRYEEITISTIKPTLADTIFALMEEEK